jgi:hypothetical protein
VIIHSLRMQIQNNLYVRSVNKDRNVQGKILPQVLKMRMRNFFENMKKLNSSEKKKNCIE